MRRIVALVAGASSAVVGVLAWGSVATSASAAAPIVGRLVDASVASSPGVANMTVRLRRDTPTGPGAVVATDVTGPAGGFSLATPATAGGFLVTVVPGRYQGGFVGRPAGSVTEWVMPAVRDASTYRPGANIGPILTLPGFARGTVVNSRTGNPVTGVIVRVTDIGDAGAVRGSDTTGVNGVFNVVGLEGEEFGVRVNGSARGFETGWLNAGSHQVVRTWGQAASVMPGRLGVVLLDRG